MKEMSYGLTLPAGSWTGTPFTWIDTYCGAPRRSMSGPFAVYCADCPGLSDHIFSHGPFGCAWAPSQQAPVLVLKVTV